MEITTRTIVFTIISVILIAAILGGVFYLLKNSKQLNLGNKGASISSLPVIQASPTSTPENISPTQTQNQTSITNTQNTKIYQGQNFILKYPADWGIVTCSNSKNIEFDPYNKNDLINYPCDSAIKPITILISNQPVSCPGDIVKIGNNSVAKSKTETANWLKNRWCLNKLGINLDVTNRIAPTGITGTSKDDFSKQIEQMISNL